MEIDKICLVSERPRQQQGYITDRSQDLLLPGYVLPHTRQERGDHDFCLRRSHYIDTNPTGRELVARVGIEPQSPH